VALIRILITVPSLAPEFGGPVIKARRLSEELRTLECQVTVIGVGGEGDTGSVNLRELWRFHATPVPAGFGPMRALVRQADVVHVIGLRDPVGTAASLWAARARVPYVVEPAGMFRKRLRSVRLKHVFDGVFAGRVLGRASAVIATSRLEKDELEQDGVPTAKLRLRPNGIDHDGTSPPPLRGALRERLGIPQGVPLVLSVGRITAKKGLLDLARALSSLPNVWGLIAGPDDGDGTLRRLLVERSSLGLEQRLLVLPHGLWGRAKVEAMVDADAFCLPSASENFGNAALEAGALGLPVVISRECGASEWLDPAASRVVPYGDVRSLIVALDEVINRSEIGAAARAAVPTLLKQLDWGTIAFRQRHIYEEVIGGSA
jgi:glycosyltransferase involved in cell wall biosynthesis